MASRPKYPEPARRHYLLSALVAQRAVREARKAATDGPAAVARVVATHQIAQARQAVLAVPKMLAAQGIASTPDAAVNIAQFTTDPAGFVAMWNQTEEFERLVESLVQDAGRAAESVATAIRPDIWHVRYLNLPSCSRCAVLAGKVYRYSDGFKRHPNCDCVMLPTTVANRDLVQDPAELAKEGHISDLSKADMKAVADGADFNQVVNVRRSEAGLKEAGRAIARKGRPTPEGIYRIASDRTEAVDLLKRYGYVL